ncbi:MAG: beta-lactamase family protein [Anaerolineae bacterium]|nr:beta-lactamase family protein [Anaerolineae bacterium]
MGKNHAEIFDQLCAFIQEDMQEKGVPGVAVGILCEDQTYTAGFGVTNADHPLPVTDETLFQIGSITKTFTCLAIMRLIEMGKLELGATVRTYLPEFRVADGAASTQATIWHLLTHMSGWVGDLFEDTGAGEDAMAKYMALMADLEQLAPVGTVWSYNNAGFYLTGYLIERITGQCYEAAMVELVFDPLGLKCCYYDPGAVITHRFAVGHQVDGREAHVLQPWPLPRAAYAAGAITCDVHELLRYARFQMGDGSAERGDGEGTEQVLKPETMAQMHTPQVDIWGEKAQMALSWFVNDIGGTRQLSHGGGTNGQISLLAFYPEHRLALAVVTNANQGGGVTDDVRRWVLEHYLGLQDPKPEPIDAAQEELAAYVGFYERPFAEIELGMLCGRLVGQMIYKAGFPSRDSPPPPPPPPVALALCEKDRLLVTAGPAKGAQADVIRKPDGSIGWIRMGRLYRRRAERSPA